MNTVLVLMEPITSIMELDKCSLVAILFGNIVYIEYILVIIDNIGIKYLFNIEPFIFTFKQY